VQAEFKRERARAERIGTSRIHEERKHTYTYTKLTCSRVHALAHSLIQRERESARARERDIDRKAHIPRDRNETERQEDKETFITEKVQRESLSGWRRRWLFSFAHAFAFPFVNVVLLRVSPFRVSSHSGSVSERLSVVVDVVVVSVGLLMCSTSLTQY
jgi:hypothetical protein